jgi:tetratricopeptide (TPR) repeat protein
MRILNALLFVSALCLASIAIAQEQGSVAVPQTEAPKPPKAADLRIAADRFDEGRAAFKIGDFLEAAEHFEAADARAPSASALALAMRSRLEAGQHAKALTLAELLLLRHPDASELAASATATIEAFRSGLGLLEITCKSRCELVIDQKLVHGAAMLSWRVYLDPGKHEVVANFDGDREALQHVMVQSSETKALNLAPEEPQSAPPQVAVAPPIAIIAPAPVLPRASAKLSPTVFWLGVGVSSVLGAATVWSGLDTHYNPGRDAVRNACGTPSDSCNRLYQEGQSKEVRTNLLLASTLTLGAITALTGLFATEFGPQRSSQWRGSPSFSVRPVAAVGPAHQAILGAEGRF